jgi:hypothetical protein
MSKSWVMMASVVLAACGSAGAAEQARVANPAASEARQDYPVGAFDSVTAAGPSVVLVSVGGPASVQAQGPAAALAKMEVVVEDGTLMIRPKERFRHGYDWPERERITYRVTVPRLRGATLAGSGNLTVDRVSGGDFAGTLAGSGHFEIGSLDVEEVTLTTAGSGDLTAHGKAARATVSVAGSGNVRARGVAARWATVSVVGSGDAQMTATNGATVSIVGSGDAEISGTDRCTVTRMGAGHARCAA